MFFFLDRSLVLALRAKQREGGVIKKSLRHGSAAQMSYDENGEGKSRRAKKLREEESGRVREGGGGWVGGESDAT
jgi:hypothetical protein